jgi:hypothetical protein
VADLVNLIRAEGAEVHTADAPMAVGGIHVERGDYVVRLDQPYGGVVETLLGVQWYPPDNPWPFDDTGWDVPALRNVTALRVDDRRLLDAPMALVSGAVRAAGRVTGSGRTIVIDHTTDNTLATFRLRNAAVPMSAAERPFDLDGHHFAAGAFVIPSADRASIEPQIRELGLAAWATDAMPAVPLHDLDVPRIAVIHTWTSTQDEGWVRLALDALHVPYEYFGDNLVRRGNLRARYDVIVYPHSPGVQVDHEGMPAGSPLPYRKTDLTPNIGSPDATGDQRGGLGIDGLRELARFVDAGGVLITEGSTAQLFSEFGITPAVAIDQDSSVLAPGSVIKTILRDRGSPILYGYDQRALAVLYRNGPLFRIGPATPRPGPLAFPPGTGGGALAPMSAPPRLTTLEHMPQVRTNASPAAPGMLMKEAVPGALVPPAPRGAVAFGIAGPVGAPRVLLSFADDPNDLLLSGELVGASGLAGRPALIDQPIGRGHLIMFACRPFWRYETHGDFFLALNAMLNWNDLDSGR